MKKHFCDKCGAEITDSNACVGGHVSTSRLGTEITFRTKGQSPLDKSHTLKLELMHTFDGTANAGDFCKYCVIDAFNGLDDRPKAASA